MRSASSSGLKDSPEAVFDCLEERDSRERRRLELRLEFSLDDEEDEDLRRLDVLECLLECREERGDRGDLERDLELSGLFFGVGFVG